MAENNISKWDSMAKHFNALKVPEWGEDDFLKLIEDLPVWTLDSQILDLGCGAGRYSIAMADKVGHIIGSDISSKMIEFANEKKQEFKKENIDFVNEDFGEIDIKSRGYDKKFNLIIGHMTPAIRDLDDIKKMNQASRGYCAMATFFERKSDLNKKLYDFLGLDLKMTPTETIPEIFTYLYEGGHLPRVSYYVRDDSKVFYDKEEAFEYLKGQIWADPKDLPSDCDEKIREFLEEHYINGELINKVDSVIVAMTWKA